jgi:sialate O-acetylesterase
MKKITIFLLVSLMILPASIKAQVKLLPIFSNNMVLQQQTQAPIWGETKQNKKVIIYTSWNKKKYVVQADAKGKWKVAVDTPNAGGPYEITISDGKTIKLTNVMIGEVWICSGQSNMEMPIEGWGKVRNYKQEEEEANNYPNIRLLLIEKATSAEPIDNIKATNNGWQICSAKSVADFSAAGYFFGRDLLKYRNVPIGLIDTSWGGTIAEAWTSAEALSAMPSVKDRLEQVKQLPATQKERQLKYQSDIETWKKNVEKVDKGSLNGKALWADTKFNDNDWETIKVPGVIQKQGLSGFNGMIWFRKVIDIPSNWIGKELTLNLGPIDDNDFTYFNGIQIGHTEGWMAPRTYKIPGNLIKGGKAIIAIRVMDTGGDGGLYGDPKNVNIQLNNNNIIDLAGDWKYKISLNLRDVPTMPVDTSNDPNVPSFLFNAMLNPLIPYSIKGAIWYQGEANTGNPPFYNELLPLMINDWRNHWNQDFPFYIVQLANFMDQQPNPSQSAWAELREAQSNTLHLDRTGLAVTIDIGETKDIHPKNKQEVGHRLALAARALTYGEKIPYSGPQYRSYKIEKNKIRIFFRHTDGGLIAKNNEALKGFAIAGVDHKFYWADAVIDGNSIIVSSKDVAFPIAVRYAWADNPICNLYNGANLPASPFRTDNWQ